MKTQLLILGVFFLVLFGSCKVSKQFAVIDGNRGAGTLTMAYEYGAFEVPMINWVETKQRAIERCRNWGYSNAEFFDRTIEECLSYNQYGNCLRTRVYIRVQCID